MSKDAANRDKSVVEGPNGRKFYGSVTVGERGQIVIPAQAKRDHDIKPGDKLLVLGSPEGLALMSTEHLMEVLDDSARLLQHISTAAKP